MNTNSLFSGLNFGLNGSLLSINTTASQKEASSGGVHHHGGGRGRSEASKGHPPRRDSSVGGSSSRSGQSATANRLSAIASLTGSTRTLAAATVTPGGNCYLENIHAAVQHGFIHCSAGFRFTQYTRSFFIRIIFIRIKAQIPKN